MSSKASHPYTEIIHRFYRAFQERDYAGMQSCYHPDVAFSDPVFTHLSGKQAMAMWHMLCEAGKDLKLEYHSVKSTDRKGTARWNAVYTFSTGRVIHNRIKARMEFSDGKIIKHRDAFNLWRWTMMALGPVGVVAGWTPVVQNRVRAQAQRQLMAFIRKHPEYQ